MNHSDLVEKLPGSIYKKDVSSGAAKLWSLAATPANELETTIVPAYDIDNQNGVQLDKIGKTFGIERLGVSDDLYRDKILNSSINQFITIPALKDLLQQYSNNPTVREMCYPIEFEWETLDSSDFLNGSGVFEPAMRVANELFFDGNGTFDGLDILDPTKVRPAAIEIDIGILSQDILSEAFGKVSKATLGITIYIKHFKEMD
ncbi:hypothetical protein MAL08_03400 [Leptospira noguchii]|uniref:hypothetical protein n=1 Tax=Leptospira noguchii TaxID=28182 RepID=UPI0011479B2B|nr:hypothetical protein [Leptospira noguchii]TQE83071.1 hypothetical protein FF021_02655 [Leptospira noguchii]UOG38388.1 hypothetical protein MAL08_03400 [Leptospira noguchii]UOG54758.1 hypothetical protein MAL09_21240 [Leptospira noguchii]